MPKHTPIRPWQTDVGLSDIRSYFGSETGQWSLGGSGSFKNTRELAGQMTGPVDIGAVRGVGHTNWVGIDESPVTGGGVWQGLGPGEPPNPGNWRRGRSGWPSNNSQGSTVTSNDGTIIIYHEKTAIAQPTSISIKGYFKANPGTRYNYIIEWYCIETQGHDFVANGKQAQSVYAGFSSFADGFQNGSQSVYPDGNHEEVGVVKQFSNNTRTWTGSFVADHVHMVPYFTTFMDSIDVNEGRTLTVGVTQHRIWEA